MRDGEVPCYAWVYAVVYIRRGVGNCTVPVRRPPAPFVGRAAAEGKKLSGSTVQRVLSTSPA